MAQKLTPAPEKEKTDWVPLLAIGGGGLALAGGLFFFLRKKPGYDIGDVCQAHFKFDYDGDPASFKLLVRFGYHRMANWFDPEEGMDRYLLEIDLPGPNEPDSPYEFDVDCEIPQGAPSRVYDAEGSILLPEHEPGKDWLIRVFKDKVFEVRES